MARETLQKRMEMVESKLIVGGVNLLDKAKEQEKYVDCLDKLSQIHFIVIKYTGVSKKSNLLFFLSLMRLF